MSFGSALILWFLYSLQILVRCFWAVQPWDMPDTWEVDLTLLLLGTFTAWLLLHALSGLKRFLSLVPLPSLDPGALARGETTGVRDERHFSGAPLSRWDELPSPEVLIKALRIRAPLLLLFLRYNFRPMLYFLGSSTPFRDIRTVHLGFSPWTVGRRQKCIGQVKFEISYRKRGCQGAIAEDGHSQRSPIDGFANTGRIFANYLSRILQPQSVKPTLEKLPVFFEKEGQRLQYAWDGKTLRIVPVDQKKEEHVFGPQSHGQLPKLVQATVDGIGRALYRTFVPEHVRTHYLVYMKWKFLHRVSSSIIQVQGTQAMLQAVGIGARRGLPAAAGLNWVLKDGLGRLGRFAFSGLLGSTFDSNLKKVRFSTSVLFSLSLGLEMLTPFFPNYFLLFATMANIGKSIALAAYLATSSAIHKSFAVEDNLADIAAKGQVQTVVADNLGLAVAVALGSLARSNKMLGPLLLLATFPVLTGLDLYAIYKELQSVHLQTLNKARLLIVVDLWLHTGQVPSPEKVSKVECRQFIQIIDRRTLPLRIGALNPRGWKREDIVQAFECQAGQSYAIFKELQSFGPFSSQCGLLLWLHDGFTAKDVITALLQAELMRTILYSKCEHVDKCSSEESMYNVPIYSTLVQEMKSKYDHLDLNRSSRSWVSLIVESREQAEASVDCLIDAMEAIGWQTRNILLDPLERQTYSTGQSWVLKCGEESIDANVPFDRFIG